MILLLSKNRYDKLAFLDFETGDLEFRSRDNEFDPPINSIQGVFSKMGRHILCLYRYKDALYFRANEKNVELTAESKVLLENLCCRRRRLTVKQKGGKVCQITYFRPISLIPPSLDPTPYVEEEDFDFGLFVYNVANDPERRAVAFQRQS